MITRSTVSKAAAARILQVAVSQIRRVEQWARCVLVVLSGCPARFVSYKSFEQDAIDFRLDGAAQLPGQITDLGDGFYAVLGKSGVYTVDARRQTCDCADFIYRRKGQPCKHLYLTRAYRAAESLVLESPTLATVLA